MDWIAVLLNIVGAYLLAKHPLKAMYVYIASSVAFLIWAALGSHWSIVLLQVFLLTLNIRVIYHWRNHEASSDSTTGVSE